MTETHQSDDEPFAVLHILEHDTEKCSAHNADEGNGNTAETRNQVAFGITQQSYKAPKAAKPPNWGLWKRPDNRSAAEIVITNLNAAVNRDFVPIS